MAEHEPQTGATDEWYTPQEIFTALGVAFDLDPCSPSHTHWTPAQKFYTQDDDGLSSPWEGFVFMNPPFGKRNGVIPWLEKFITHGNGIGIARAYTSADWFQKYMPKMDCLLFPYGKTKFIRPDGSIGKSPGSGVVIFGIGEKAFLSIKNSKLGYIFVDNRGVLS